jgi:hypothetical protein
MGGSFMTGIDPGGNDTFHPKAIEKGKLAGVWLKIYGEGIYVTHAREASFGNKAGRVEATDPGITKQFMRFH